MLARKYNYEEQWAQSEQERLRELKELQERRQRIRKANYKLFRRRLFVTVGFILVMYAVTVMRSAALVSAGNHQIEVDQLKGPERITSIAEKQLGMKVARSNIYVKDVSQ